MLLIGLVHIAVPSKEARDSVLRNANLHSLLDEARPVIFESEDYSDDDSVLSADLNTELEDIIEDLTTCVQCLVDMGPSLECPAKNSTFKSPPQEKSEEDRVGFGGSLYERDVYDNVCYVRRGINSQVSQTIRLSYLGYLG